MSKVTATSNQTITEEVRIALQDVSGQVNLADNNRQIQITRHGVVILPLDKRSEQVLTGLVSWVKTRGKKSERFLEEKDSLLQSLSWGVEAKKWNEVFNLVQKFEEQLILNKEWAAWETVLNWGGRAARSLGDEAGVGWVLHQLGSRALCLGNTKAGRRLLIEALRIREKLGDRIGAAVTRHNLDLISSPPQNSFIPPPETRPSNSPVNHPRVSKSPSLLLFGVILPTIIIVILLLIIWSLFPPQRSPIVPPTATPTPTSTSTSTPTNMPTNTPTRTPPPTLMPTNTLPPPTITPTIVSTPVNIPMDTPEAAGIDEPGSLDPVEPTSSPVPIEPTPPDTTRPPPPLVNNPGLGDKIFCLPGQQNVEVVFGWGAVSDPSGISHYELVIRSNDGRDFEIGPITELEYKKDLPCGEIYSWLVYAVDRANNPGEGTGAREFKTCSSRYSFPCD